MRIPAIILLLLPLAEIAGFVLVGQWLGVLTTLALIVASTLLGIIVLRNNGLTISQKLRSGDIENKPGRLAKAVLDGSASMFGGLLLVIPGFITDILGLLLLIPFIRSVLWSFIKLRFVTVSSEANFQWREGPAKSDTVVDLDAGEYKRQDPNTPSPWKQLPKDEG
ncbi:FxsA family protein [Rhizobium sp.]|jgi:UPF0716 protein FxsA|uniref:FxsA family protein n=1 Tax=Rhizobium sp. TaxID=391 RepID=UPI000E84C345|nr:membrane protein FxsA [Rhizobium sp.]